MYVDINVKPLAQPGDPDPVPPPPAPGRSVPFNTPLPGTPVGATYTGWLPAAPGCVDVSHLDVPRTPEEVYEQFILSPIPGLGLSVQPPDLGLVNLPEICFTAKPTTGTYTVDVRAGTRSC